MRLYADEPSSSRTASASALPHRLVVFAFVEPTAAGLLAAAVHLIYSRPRPAFSLVLRKSALFVPFFDVLGLALLLVRI